MHSSILDFAISCTFEHSSAGADLSLMAEPVFYPLSSKQRDTN